MAHKLEKPKNIAPIDQERMLRYVKEMVDMKNELIRSGEVNNKHVYISGGNGKMGETPSVSLIPIHDCTNCKACSKLCYDLRNDCCYSTVRKTRAVNSAILESDPERFMNETHNFIKENKPTHFRWHVGGDVKNVAHFEIIASIAIANPRTSFLLFTKNDKVVNEYRGAHFFFPRNLHVIFSNWVGQVLDNPYNFPTSNPIFGEKTMDAMGYTERTTAKEGDRICTGDCTACFKGTCEHENPMQMWHGCWTLKEGEGVVFFAH